MPIPFDTFHDWCVAQFGDDNVSCRGDEVCVNSPFVPAYDPDRGFHLQCNPEKNAYHCFKSGEHGNLFRLVEYVEGCSYPEAVEALSGGRELYRLTEKIRKYFQDKKKSQPPPNTLALPEGSTPIAALAEPTRRRVTDYLAGRGLRPGNLLYCGSGLYRERIVIPYYGPAGNLIYFNTRDISGRARLRYRGPPKEVGVGKSDVVWARGWPPAGATVHVTEGEFDAMSLCEVEYHGMAVGGKEMGERQLLLLSQYDIVICFDLDKSGQEALNKISNYVRQCQYVRGRDRDYLGCVVPPKGFKDWNEVLVNLGPGVLHGWVKERQQHLDWANLQRLRLHSQGF